MKRMFAVALLLLFLAGCSGPGENGTVTTAVPVETTEATVEPTIATTAPEQTTEPPETTVPTEATVPTETDPVANMYQDLVDDYRFMVNYRLSADFKGENLESACFKNPSETMRKILAQDKDNSYRLGVSIFELPMSAEQTRESDFGYLIHDINADGIPELFWMREDHSIVAIFTRKKDEMVLLYNFWSRCRGYISQDNAFYVHGSSGAADNDCTVYTLENGKHKEVFRFGSESYGAGNVRLFEIAGEQDLEISKERWEDLHKQFPDAVCEEWKAVRILPLDREVLPTETDGSTTQKPSSKNQRLPFLQKIRRIDQALQAGPGEDYLWLGNMGETGTYTIVGDVRDEYGQLWGKLKSGSGWVNLTQLRNEAENMPLVTAAYADERLLKSGNHEHYTVTADEYTQKIAICAHKNIKNIQVYSLSLAENYAAEQLLFPVSELKSGKFFTADISFPGDMSAYGIRFADENGESYSYILMESGMGGLELIQEDFA